MADPILYGPGYSTYTRSARLTLEEKGVPYSREEVTTLTQFVTEGMPKEQLARHPFNKVPAFEHDGNMLYETPAIERYVDEAFDGPSLQPSGALGRARMTQVIGVADCYAYDSWDMQIVIPRLVVPMMGGTTDEAAVEAALPEARKTADALETLIGDQSFMAGESLSLADLHLVPIMVYFAMAPEGAQILEGAPKLAGWLERMKARPTVAQYCPAEIA